MTSAIAERFMRSLQEIEDTRNLEPLVSMFAEDAELSNLGMTQPVYGRDGARKFWQKYLSVFKQIHSRFTNVVESDSTAVLEWISEGTLSSGEPVSYKGVSIIELDNNQVRKFRTYYDSAVFLPQGAKV